MSLKPAAEKSPAKEGGVFEVTRWSVVLRAKDKSELALNTLFTCYRQPLLVHLRSLGLAHPEAEDVLQSFLLVLLKRDFLKNVTAEKGRFRTFLLKSLDNFVKDEHDKAKAGKRGGGQEIESLDATTPEGQQLHDPADSLPAADREYDIAWGKIVLKNALAHLQEECRLAGRAKLYDLLEPVFFKDEESLGYEEIGRAVNLSEAAVKAAAHRVRARLRYLIQDEIKQTVTNPEDWKEECAYLLNLFE